MNFERIKFKNFRNNPTLGRGPFERDFKLISVPLKEALGRPFRIRFLDLKERIRDRYQENYWGGRFLERWNVNRWPLRRSDSTEIMTLGSESFVSSNHDSLRND